MHMESPGSTSNDFRTIAIAISNLNFELNELYCRTWTILWFKTRIFEIFRDSPILFWFPLYRLMIGRPYLFICALAIAMFIILAVNMSIVLAVNIFYHFGGEHVCHFEGQMCLSFWRLIVYEILISETYRTILAGWNELAIQKRVVQLNQYLALATSAHVF